LFWPEFSAVISEFDKITFIKAATTALAINKLRFFLQLIKSNHFAILRQKDKQKVSREENA